MTILKEFAHQINQLKTEKLQLEQRITVLEGIVSKNADQPSSSTSNASKKKNKIKPRVKQACWEKYAGDVAKTKCFCCRVTDITFSNFNCGHVKAHSNGGTISLDNLRPICAPCNGAMGCKDMREFAKEHFNVDIDA
jgi:hypothetical protein